MYVYELFEEVMKNIFINPKISSDALADYLWCHMEENFKRQRRIATADYSRLSEGREFSFFAETIKVQSLQPFSRNFAREIWDNATGMFKCEWSLSTEETDVASSYLVKIFSEKMKL